jgi:hypothetical protein
VQAGRRHLFTPPLDGPPRMYKTRRDEWINITWLSQQFSLEFYSHHVINTILPIAERGQKEKAKNRAQEIQG